VWMVLMASTGLRLVENFSKFLAIGGRIVTTKKDEIKRCRNRKSSRNE
jgi:hypothetical protein